MLIGKKKFNQKHTYLFGILGYFQLMLIVVYFLYLSFAFEGNKIDYDAIIGTY